MGLAKNICMSNMTVHKLEQVLPLCRVKPALIEMELHTGVPAEGACSSTSRRMAYSRLDSAR